MSAAPSAPITAQFGERNLAADLAWDAGIAAATALGLTALLTPLPSHDPGAWRCELRRAEVPVPHGLGWGKGLGELARVGALFEALEHHLSLGVRVAPAAIDLVPAHEVARGGLVRDAALAVLADGPDEPLACLPYRAIGSGDHVRLPLFLSTPTYHENEPLRAAYRDRYDYTSAARYSMNNGWAAGTNTDDALVHALNEIVERDAMSLLLIEQFLAPRRPALRVTEPDTLPAGLRALYDESVARIGAPVALLDMTTDLGVPAYWAYTPAPSGEPARLRGCGASLSRFYAIERALTELIQLHSIESTGTHPVAAPTDFTAPYPPLHRCYLADLSPLLADAEPVAYAETATPRTPADHLDVLADTLARHGFPAYARTRHDDGRLAVVHAFVPGLERFMVITDGQLVLPGARGRALAG